MSFSIRILGNNAAVPAHGRNQTSQLVKLHNQFILIDCGENTQISLLQNKVNLNKIHHIFISHLHGDHYYGLMGLLSTMQLYGRTKSLNIFAPAILKDIIDLNLKASDTQLKYEINFTSTDDISEGVILDHKYFEVGTFLLNHRISCHGYIIREKHKPHRIIKEKLHKDVKLQHIATFLKGEDVYDHKGNILYAKDEYTLPPKKSRSYAFCSDTAFDESIVKHIKGVDVLYHESTFLENMTERARETFHTTARQAASIAKQAEAGRLFLGHYSTRYKDLQPFVEEARKEFENSFLSLEGEEIYILE